MAEPSRLQVLAPSEVEAIQSASHHLLARVGVKVPRADILDRLASAGAKIDRANQIVRFPEGLILDSVARAGKSYTLYGRDRKKQAHFGQGGNNFLSSAGQYAWVDPIAKTRRNPTTADTIKAIRLGDALPEINIVGAMAIPTDVPMGVRDVVANVLLACWIYNGITAHYVLDILAVVSGGRHELARYPLCEGFVQSASPLQFHPEGLEVLVEFANAGLPVGFGPMVIAIATGPATLAGTLVQENAEILAGIVIAQVLKPGLPVTYWGIPHVMDVATGRVSFGSAEQGIMAVAMTQIGKAYGLPVGINVGLTDAKIPDAQAGLEKGMTLLMGALAGADIFGHMGVAGAEQGASLPQLVIDNEMAAYVRRIIRGFEVNAETLALEIIEKVGIGGNFLAELYTLTHLYYEVMSPKLLDRHDWGTWFAAGGRSLLERAVARIDEILAIHRVEPLPEGQQRDIEAIVAEATARLTYR